MEKYLINFPFLVLFTCCKDISKHQEPVAFSKKINIDEATVKDLFDITDLIDTIEVIPLKEKQHYLLGDIYKIFYLNRKFIIHDRLNAPQILSFNEDGTFNKRLLGLGRGPEEALQIDDCWLNPDGSFDAYDDALKEVYHFDKNLQFKTSIKGNKNLYQNLIRISNSDNFLAYSPLNSYNIN